MPDSVVEPQFWLGLGQIIIVNVILSGDNAVVIALAARSLPERQRRMAVLWGSVAAIAMRIVLTVAAVELLKMPYLKIVGSLLLLWIAVQLLLPERDNDGDIEDHGNLMAAIRTILLADLVMSLDNVIAVAAAARGDSLLLILGLGISIPLVIFGSTIIMRLMDRFPIIVTLGAALLGYVAGEMLISDPGLAGSPWLALDWVAESVPILAAVIVVAMGKFLASQEPVAESAALVDLAAGDEQTARRERN
jgi:YjbE family integral membrane protein